jgi:hypothetical protein
MGISREALRKKMIQSWETLQLLQGKPVHPNPTAEEVEGDILPFKKAA